MVLSTPLVSVIIPTYNRYEFLMKAIESVKKQTYPHIEIIVVDDCSTEEAYKNFNIDGVKYYRLDKNTRQAFGFVCTAFVRNWGIAHSNGIYVAFLDDDDWWVEDKIEKQMKAIQSVEGVEMCSTDAYHCTSLEKRVMNKDLFWDHHKGKFKLEDNFPVVWDHAFLKIHNVMITSSVMVSRNVLDQVKGFRCMPNQFAEDYDCWLSCLKFTKSVYVDEPLVYYDGDHGYGRNW